MADDEEFEANAEELVVLRWGGAEKGYDPVTFDLLKVNAMDIATQITLRDLPIFESITVEELSSCGWTSKAKHVEAPNIVEFTYQFNVTCLWTQQEILNGVKLNRRVELLSHFITIAKKLLQLNNIHSAFAVVSALLGHPIYRLKKTWAKIGRSDKNTFEKLIRLFSSDSNWEKLRHFIDTRKLPCIPYLGLYLTDLSFVHDVMNHRSPSNVEDRKMHEDAMNRLIRSIAAFQDSNYDHLLVIPYIQQYLDSLRFHREMIRFVEEDLYRLSLLRESEDPERLSLRRSSLPRSLGMLFSKTQSPSPYVRSPETSSEQRPPRTLANKPKSLTPSLIPARLHGRFRPTHKKTHSLGDAKVFGVENPGFVQRLPLSHPFSPSNLPRPFASTPATHPKTSLDVLMSSDAANCSALDATDCSSNVFESTANSVSCNALDLSELQLDCGVVRAETPLSSAKVTPRTVRSLFSRLGRRSEQLCRISEEDKHAVNVKRRVSDTDITKQPLLSDNEPEMQGVAWRCVVRAEKSKAVKIRLSQRYYLELRQSVLYEFERRSLVFHVSAERDEYRSKPRRVLQLRDAAWKVIRAAPEHGPSFELHHPSTGRIVRYRCSSSGLAMEWYQKLLASVADETPSVLIGL